MAWAIGLTIGAGVFLLIILMAAAARAAGRYDDESDAMMMDRDIPPEAIRLRGLDGQPIDAAGISDRIGTGSSHGRPVTTAGTGGSPPPPPRR